MRPGPMGISGRPAATTLLHPGTHQTGTPAQRRHAGHAFWMPRRKGSPIVRPGFSGFSGFSVASPRISCGSGIRNRSVSASSFSRHSLCRIFLRWASSRAARTFQFPPRPSRPGWPATANTRPAASGATRTGSNGARPCRGRGMMRTRACGCDEIMHRTARSRRRDGHDHRHAPRVGFSSRADTRC